MILFSNRTMMILGALTAIVAVFIIFLIAKYFNKKTN